MHERIVELAGLEYDRSALAMGGFLQATDEAFGAARRTRAALASQLSALVESTDSRAFAAQQALTTTLSELDRATLYGDLGQSIVETIASTSALATRLHSDAAALAESIDTITANQELWPARFGEAAETLASLADVSVSVFEPFHNASAAADIVSRLANTALPEPLLSDAMRVYGLSSERIHTPTYWIPPVEPIRSLSGAHRGARKAIQRRLTDAGDTLFELEQTLRELIATRLSQHYGPAWWKRQVPQTIRDECARRKQDREAPGSLVHDPIDYTFTAELKDIILKRDNWEPVFKPIFQNPTLVEATFLWIEPVRKDIAHSRISADADYKTFKFAATWLIDAAGNAVESAIEEGS
jgi:hypothetical protein